MAKMTPGAPSSLTDHFAIIPFFVSHIFGVLILFLHDDVALFLVPLSLFFALHPPISPMSNVSRAGRRGKGKAKQGAARPRPKQDPPVNTSDGETAPKGAPRARTAVGILSSNVFPAPKLAGDNKLFRDIISCAIICSCSLEALLCFV